MFSAFAVRISRLAAHPLVFAASVVVVIAWAICGPFFLYSENWQLVINTGTTIISFWLSFLILAAGSREARATQAKLDELIRALPPADNRMIGLQERSDEEIEAAMQRVVARMTGTLQSSTPPETARPVAHLVEQPKIIPCPFNPWDWIK